jgi:hypothetical protein
MSVAAAVVLLSRKTGFVLYRRYRGGRPLLCVTDPRSERHQSHDKHVATRMRTWLAHHTASVLQHGDVVSDTYGPRMLYLCVLQPLLVMNRYLCNMVVVIMMLD